MISKAWVALAGSVLVLGLIACDDVECGPGTEDRDGRCLPSNPDARVEDSSANEPDGGGITCGPGTRLVGRQCVPESSSGPGDVGAACSDGSDCLTGTCASADNLPGGYCTELQCDMEHPCPVGSTCYQLNKSLSLCMAQCDREGDCRHGENYHCQPLYANAINICTPSCELTKACTAGTRCNSETGLCELSQCEVAASSTGCNDEETCYPDTLGLSSKGGLCLDLCDPSKPAEKCLVDKNEVCQPMANDPSKGFCSPPVCSKTSECPADAVCIDRKCEPPALCDEDSPCPDDRTCAFGRCMRKCPSEYGCWDIHPGLDCVEELSTPACLPNGAYPGSSCRGDACDSFAGKPMLCNSGKCTADCSTGGDALCTELSSTLQCARGFLSEDFCLPKGSFPDSTCGNGIGCGTSSPDNTNMMCIDGTCMVPCSSPVRSWSSGDDICAYVDRVCSESVGRLCFRGCEDGSCPEGFACIDAGDKSTHENACVPIGKLPGSPCRSEPGDQCDQNLNGDDAIDMTCIDDRCVVTCPSGNDSVCEGLGWFTCSEAAGNVCVPSCWRDNECPAGLSCFDPGDATHEHACLPTGSFFHSPCRTTPGDECDENLSGDDALDMTCVQGKCTIPCATNDDALCQAIDSRLTCAETAGNVCAWTCQQGGGCDVGYECYDPGGENVCLPTGSFVGSPCVNFTCDSDLNGVAEADLMCVNNVCTLPCPSNNDALCQQVSSGLTCSESAGNVCVRACVGAVCPTGYSCREPGASPNENACVPNGTFPGSTCRMFPIGMECDQNFSGMLDLVCVAQKCAIVCTGDDDALCNNYDSTLTCTTANNTCVPACVNDQCDPGYTCDTGEDACNPDD